MHNLFFRLRPAPPSHTGPKPIIGSRTVRAVVKGKPPHPANLPLSRTPGNGGNHPASSDRDRPGCRWMTRRSHTIHLAAHRQMPARIHRTRHHDMVRTAQLMEILGKAPNGASRSAPPEPHISRIFRPRVPAPIPMIAHHTASLQSRSALPWSSPAVEQRCTVVRSNGPCGHIGNTRSAFQLA